MRIDIDFRGVPKDEATWIRHRVETSESHGHELDFRGVPITDAGAKAVADALPHSSVTDLELGYQSISEVGVRALATALPSSRLTRLTISINFDLDDGSGIAGLAEIIRKSNLSTLIIRDNTFNESYTNALVAAVPYSKIPYIGLWFQGGIRFSKAINLALSARNLRNKLFLLLRLMVFWRSDGDNAMLNRVAGFLMR